MDPPERQGCLEAGGATADDGDVCAHGCFLCMVGGVLFDVDASVYLHVNMKASDRDQTWTVGELAARFGLPTNVLRHWESLGLLTPERDASGYRRYRPGDLVRVAVILRNKAAGMTLEQIGVLLDGEAKGGTRCSRRTCVTSTREPSRSSGRAR